MCEWHYWYSSILEWLCKMVSLHADSRDESFKRLHLPSNGTSGIKNETCLHNITWASYYDLEIKHQSIELLHKALTAKGKKPSKRRLWEKNSQLQFLEIQMLSFAWISFILINSEHYIATLKTLRWWLSRIQKATKEILQESGKIRSKDNYKFQFHCLNLSVISSHLTSYNLYLFFRLKKLFVAIIWLKRNVGKKWQDLVKG